MSSYNTLLQLLSGANNQDLLPEEKRKLKEALEYLDSRINELDAEYKNKIAELEKEQKAYENKVRRLSVERFTKREIEKLVDKRVQEKAIKKTYKNYTTKTRYKDGYTLTDSLTMVSSQGKGIISQILCKAQTNNFGVFIMLDDNLIFEKSYSYFEDLSDYLENISAFDDGGKYFLSIRKLQFKKNMRVDITTTGSTVFDNILVKYIIRDDIPRLGAD